jgi:arylsulfatase A-like enzyme
MSILKNTFGVFFLLMLLMVSFIQCNSPEEQKLPNIVLIFIDDQGYADLGVYGAKGWETPNLDQLAAEGMRFTDFYASTAVCSASRASLLTGCYPPRVSISGALNPYAKVGLNLEEETIADLLKQKDYATAIYGKWHLGHDSLFLPLNQGFDEYYGLPYSNDMWPVGFDGVPNGKKRYPALTLIDGNEKVEEVWTIEDQATLTTKYTEKAVNFIKQNKDNPFFLYVPHSMAHVPIGVSDKFKGKSEQGLYGDMTMELDWSVGQIVQALEESGVDDNTLIIYTSDNGPWLNFGNHAGSALPLREGKGTMWEGGPRVPCIIKWPGHIEPGTVCESIASTIDVLPTIAEITNIPMSGKKIDGVSILPLFTGQEGANPRNTFLYYYDKGLCAVREGDWKLVFPHTYRSYLGVEPGNDGFPGKYARGESGLELYNLREDISEQNNVIDQHPEIVERLQKIGEQARYELGDAFKKMKGQEVREPGRLGPTRDSRVAHKAEGKTVKLLTKPHDNYPGEGGATLTNGYLGSFDFRDGQWLGFWAQDAVAVLDLGAEQQVDTVEANFLQEQGSWIFLPKAITLSISADGQNFQPVASMAIPMQADYESLSKGFAFEVNAKTRFIKIEAANIGKCPDWHVGAGGDAWVFFDEIMVK